MTTPDAAITRPQDVATAPPPAATSAPAAPAAPRATPGAAGRSAPPARSSAPARERLLSLDVFRGMTVAGMLLVNDPGSWSSIYPPLEHATWHGWTPTDLIFPFFLFIVGITTSLSLSTRRARGADDGAIVRQILRRGALIFLFGFLLSWFPFFTWGSVDGVTDPTFLQRVVDRLLHVRILGVLQRIALAYTAAALLTLRTSLKQQVVLLATLLYGYWFAMTLLPVPGSGILGALTLDHAPATLAAWLDRALLDWGPLGNHLWASSKTWDPEGVLSTLPAIGTAMLGVFAGRWIGSGRPLHERIAGLFAAGAVGMMAGAMWGWSFPINKSLWTSSYVLFTGGMAATALATAMWLIDAHRVTGWTKFFVVFGVNPIVAFVGSGLMARLIYSIIKVPYQGKPVSLQSAIYNALYASWLPANDASLLFAVSFVLVWFGILYALYRKGIILKV
ncbi:MAG: acyltransferase family protein [Gemmatimonadaceae bacterium]